VRGAFLVILGFTHEIINIMVVVTFSYREIVEDDFLETLLEEFCAFSRNVTFANKRR